MNQLERIACVWGVLVIVATSITAQDNKKEVFNEDESKVPEYTLPEVLVSAAGEKIDTPQKWNEQRRGELLRLFETEVYGRTPTKGPKVIRTVVTEGSTDALNGKALRKQITVYFTALDDGPRMDILVYMPKKSKLAIEVKIRQDSKSDEDEEDKPSKKKKKRQTKLLVPLFLGYNFEGNHAVTTDPAVKLAHSWLRNNAKEGVTENKATEASRGSEKSRWDIEQIISRGYAVATVYYGDIDPDFDDDFQNGIEPLFYHDGQSRPDPDEWGSIGAWAWGLSRALDHLQADAAAAPESSAEAQQVGESEEPADDQERRLVNIDTTRVAVLGHSRLGKTSLWAGAQDERFALVISNNSGCGGAALSKRWFGETVNRINTSFPHWFCDNFNQYNNNEASLPVDSHELIALIAPRPVYISSAVDDKWADPLGEYLSAFHADPVYRLLGTNGLGDDPPSATSPEVNQPMLNGQIGYHIRSGGHDVRPYDWEQFMNFADRHFGKK